MCSHSLTIQTPSLSIELRQSALTTEVFQHHVVIVHLIHAGIEEFYNSIMAATGFFEVFERLYFSNQAIVRTSLLFFTLLDDIRWVELTLVWAESAIVWAELAIAWVESNVVWAGYGCSGL